jgi:hypothetical protein
MSKKRYQRPRRAFGNEQVWYDHGPGRRQIVLEAELPRALNGHLVWCPFAGLAEALDGHEIMEAALKKGDTRPSYQLEPGVSDLPNVRWES